MSNSITDDDDAGDPAAGGPYFTTKVFETLPINLFGEDDEGSMDAPDDSPGFG